MRTTKQIGIFVFSLLLFISSSIAQQVFEVNLNDRSGDTFKVTLLPEQLSDSNNVFQFAAAAPGTYQAMDIGRFVKDFKAYDAEGNEIKTDHNSTDEWTISNPRAVKKITYQVADIWDTPVKTNMIYHMCSSTISDDFVMINGQAVFGYLKGMQSEPIKIKIDYPSDWLVGTALRKDKDGYYEADTFDKVVDSPFYLGKLTKESTTVGGADIDIYTYSKTGMIKSKDIMNSLKDILKAESDFTKGLPVDHYTFLFWFGNIGAGAWEHSYSSEYVMNEDSLTPAYAQALRSIVAHEFFHVNVPLNIHSELIAKFNFVKPVMSQHLWFYEGTTEWAANILQLRDHLISLKQYLNVLHNELTMNDNFDQNISLTELGLHSIEMQDQYPNIYQKGAFVSCLLDLRLLELSHGQKGLRELIIELSKKYGPKHAFSEKNFFNEIVGMTYPEIRDFIDRYIKRTDKLPVKEYFSKIGINYSEDGGVDSSKVSLGIGLGLVKGAIGVVKVNEKADSNYKVGDIVEKVEGNPLTLQNAREVFSKLRTLQVGDSLTMTIKRGDKELTFTNILQPRPLRHIFEVNPDATAEQLKLREAWMENL